MIEVLQNIKNEISQGISKSLLISFTYQISTKPHFIESTNMLVALIVTK